MPYSPCIELVTDTTRREDTIRAMNRSLTLFLLGISLALTFSLGSGNLEVQTRHGKVKGQTVSLNSGKNTVNSYMGIPFAKPPVGDLRWKAPEDPDPWTKTFVADHLRSACIQNRTGILWLTHLFWDDYSEDCLHLNIYTPNDFSKGLYPVMVWFHGGGFMGGANIQYPGHFLAAKGVVVVVPNYRLGPLGFASTGDSASPGNYGMLDQVKALQFVQDNIKNFGGDPRRVTLFGQSAGGASTALHTLSPLSKDLFHQVIQESGTDLAMWAFQGVAQKPWEYTKEAARAVGCPDSDNTLMMACLRTKDAFEITERLTTCTPGYFCQGFAPVQDNVFLTGDPYVLRQQGQFKKVPTMNGHMTEDGSLYAALLIPELVDRGFTQVEMEEWLKEVSDYFTIPHPGKARDVYEALRFYYSPWGQRNNMDANRDKINEIFTDVGFGYSGDIQLKQVSKYSPTYSFLMKYRSVNASEVFPEWMGVPHNGELPYVWGWTEVTKNPGVHWESKFTHDIVAWNTEDSSFTEFYLTLWTNFAKTGNPTPQPVNAPLNGDPVTWEKYDEQDLKTLWIDRQVSHVQRYRQRNFAFWTEYMEGIITNSTSVPTAVPQGAGYVPHWGGNRV